MEKAKMNYLRTKRQFCFLSFLHANIPDRYRWVSNMCFVNLKADTLCQNRAPYLHHCLYRNLHDNSSNNYTSKTIRLFCWLFPCISKHRSVDQVLKLGVNEREHNCASAVENCPAFEKGPWLRQPGLWLEAEVDGVHCHREKVAKQGQRFWR